jgi:hypothetical protein
LRAVGARAAGNGLCGRPQRVDEAVGIRTRVHHRRGPVPQPRQAVAHSGTRARFDSGRPTSRPHAGSEAGRRAWVDGCSAEGLYSSAPPGHDRHAPQWRSLHFQPAGVGARPRLRRSPPHRSRGPCSPRRRSGSFCPSLLWLRCGAGGCRPAGHPCGFGIGSQSSPIRPRRPVIGSRPAVAVVT